MRNCETLSLDPAAKLRASSVRPIAGGCSNCLSDEVNLFSMRASQTCAARDKPRGHIHAGAKKAAPAAGAPDAHLTQRPYSVRFVRWLFGSKEACRWGLMLVFPQKSIAILEHRRRSRHAPGGNIQTEPTDLIDRWREWGRFLPVRSWQKD